MYYRLKLQKKKKSTVKSFRLIITNKKKAFTGNVKDVIGVYYFTNNKNKEFTLNVFKLMY